MIIDGVTMYNGLFTSLTGKKGGTERNKNNNNIASSVYKGMMTAQEKSNKGQATKGEQGTTDTALALTRFHLRLWVGAYCPYMMTINCRLKVERIQCP